MSSVIIAGDVSGSVTLQAPATAGSTVVNLPSTLGNTGTSSFATTDASGNLGLGVTPSAWGTANSEKVIQNPAGALWNFQTGYQVLGQNYYRNSAGNKIYTNTAAATEYQQTGGQHAWYNAASGTAGATVSFTQAMTLDASGNLLLGTTSQINSAKYSFATPSSGFGAVFRYIGGTNNPGLFISTIESTNTTQVFSSSSGGTDQLAFGSGGTERARIDSSGNLLVGTTSTTPASSNVTGAAIRPGGYMSQITGDGGPALGLNRSADNGDVLRFYRGGTLVGSASVTASATAYNTSSDYRLKENIAPMTGALSVVEQLKPCTYNWKSDGSEGQGFIAHELAEVVPDCVTGAKDAVETYTDEEGNEQTRPVYQGIDTSFLVATLTKAIQEQQTLITQLQADVAALKGQA